MCFHFVLRHFVFYFFVLYSQFFFLLWFGCLYQHSYSQIQWHQQGNIYWTIKLALWLTTTIEERNAERMKIKKSTISGTTPIYYPGIKKCLCPLNLYVYRINVAIAFHCISYKCHVMVPHVAEELRFSYWQAQNTFPSVQGFMLPFFPLRSVLLFIEKVCFIFGLVHLVGGSNIGQREWAIRQK